MPLMTQPPAEPHPQDPFATIIHAPLAPPGLGAIPKVSEPCAARGCGLSRSALRRRRCRVVGTRWAQWHALNLRSDLGPQVGDRWCADLRSQHVAEIDSVDRLGALEKEHGALLGELASLKVEHATKAKELVVTRARENILQIEVNMLRKFPKLSTEQVAGSPSKSQGRTLKKNNSEVSSSSESTRCTSVAEGEGGNMDMMVDILLDHLAARLQHVSQRNFLILEQLRGVMARFVLTPPIEPLTQSELS